MHKNAQAHYTERPISAVPQSAQISRANNSELQKHLKLELDRARRISLHDMTLQVSGATYLSRSVVCQFLTREDVNQYDPDEEENASEI